MGLKPSGLRSFLLFMLIAPLASLANATTHLWTGQGEFAVVYQNSKYVQPCSFVLVQLIEDIERVQLSTRYNCEDDEDQEFVPLTLEREGDALYFNKVFVGRLQNQHLKLELKVGRQIETYSLNFQQGETANFIHTSDLGGPGIGILKSQLRSSGGEARRSRNFLTR